MFAVIRMIIVGLIVGVLARFFYPGAVPLGWVASIVLGIGGSFVGGLIHQMFNRSAAKQPLHPAGLLMSVIGAMVLIFVCRLLHLI